MVGDAVGGADSRSARPGTGARAARRTPAARSRLLPRPAKAAVFVACLVPAAWIAYKLATSRLGPNPIRELEDETGLWTLRLLAATLAVTPVRRLTGWNGVVKYRRMLGLFTFFYATVHLSMWAGVDWFFAWGDMWHEIVKHKYILVGMATWLVLLPLALTSTKASARRLGKRWVALHRLVYVAAITGTVHYLWAVKKDTFYPAIYLGIFVALLGFRVLTAQRLSRRLAR